MKKVRHRHVVQFIGACTQRPNLCIVFEFMPSGSMYDHLKRVTSSPSLPTHSERPSPYAANSEACFRSPYPDKIVSLLLDSQRRINTLSMPRGGRGHTRHHRMRNCFFSLLMGVRISQM